MTANPPAGSFSGELGVLGLFDLGQLLMLNGATGCLVIHCGSKRGFLYYTSGRLVNAVDDTYAQGEAAAYQIFAWKSGAFQFRPEPPTGSTTIQNSTESVMMEAARLMDESSLAAGAGPGPKATELLSERQASLEALRDVFREVTNEASGAGAKSDLGPSPTLHLYELARPGDRLVYRPGHPPRMRQADVWRETADPPLTPEDYQKVRAYLLDLCRPAAEADAESAARNEGPAPLVADERGVCPTSWTLGLADGRSIGLDVLPDGPDEALWLRPVAVPAPDPSLFKGSLDRLQQVFGITQGLVLVGGPDLDSARQMLHAVIALLLGDASESLLLVSGDRTYQHREHAGVLLRAEPHAMRGVLRAVHPDIVALDPALDRGDVSLDDLEIVPRVIASAVVSDPAALVARWLIRIGHDLERAQVSLAATPIGLVMAYPGALDQDSLAFNAWILSERERSLALRGETGTLSPLLQQATARLRQERRKKAA